MSSINVLNPYFRYVYGYMRTLNSKELVLRSSIAMDIIRTGGVTKYLCLDRDDMVQELTKVAVLRALVVYLSLVCMFSVDLGFAFVDYSVVVCLAWSEYPGLLISIKHMVGY